eukprot:488833-Heterocapsa_arctica.AAC.1
MARARPDVERPPGTGSKSGLSLRLLNNPWPENQKMTKSYGKITKKVTITYENGKTKWENHETIYDSL